MIVTAHQPNYLPGLNVVTKVADADAVIWLDEVQYSHGGWTNRNLMPDGSWLTVPVDRGTDMGPMNRVRIAEHGDWRSAHQRALEQHYGPGVAGLCAELARPYRLLVGLNLALLRILLADADETRWHFQSHLDGGRNVVAVSDDSDELAPISARLAMMTAEIGGTVYLSGPSARRSPSGGGYLNESPFHELGIEVRYFDYKRASSPCSAALLTLDRRHRRYALAA